MNSKRIFGILLIGILCIFIAMKTFSSENGPHGGRVQASDNYNIEVKITTPNIYAFLLDKEKKPIDNKGIGCEVRFYFPDSSITDLAMKPYQKDGFILETDISRYSSFQLSFKIAGKTISSKFDNEKLMVNKDKK